MRRLHGRDDLPQFRPLTEYLYPLLFEGRKRAFLTICGARAFAGQKPPHTSIRKAAVGIMAHISSPSIMNRLAHRVGVFDRYGNNEKNGLLIHGDFILLSFFVCFRSLAASRTLHIFSSRARFFAPRSCIFLSFASSSSILVRTCSACASSSLRSSSVKTDRSSRITRSQYALLATAISCS